MADDRRRWFEAFNERLRAVVRRRVASRASWPDEREAVSDLTQEALADAARSLDDFDGETEEHLIAWVYAIAENRLHDYRRYARAQRRDVRRTSRLGDDIDPADEAETPDAALHRSDGRALLLRLLDRLPSAEREAVRLRYLEGRSFAEIAARLYRSEEAAKALVKRGLAKLRKLAEPERRQDAD